jgi:large subunit ribosomal protein L25
MSTQTRRRQVEEVVLKVSARSALGHKCKALRREGITPVHLFGHGIESLALQCDTSELRRTLSQAGKTTLINLKIDKSKTPRKVLLRGLQRRSGDLLHVDFYQVKLTEKIAVEVPIALVGEAPAVKSHDAMVLQDLSSITVECLPTEIPDNIEVDLSTLEELGQAVLVKDITLGEGIAVITDPEQMIVKASSKVIEVIEKPEVEEVAAEEEMAEVKPEEVAEAAPEAEGEQASSQD